MNKSLLILFIVLCYAAPALAGNAGNSTNHSAEYLRTLNRNASTGIDAAIYNPAGTVKLPPGMYISANNQVFFKGDTVTFGGRDYVADDPVYLYPAGSFVFRRENLALFFHAGVPAGGGSKTFEKGHPLFVQNEQLVTDSGNAQGREAGVSVDIYESSALKGDGYVKGTEAYLGLTFGAAYAINDMISVAAGARWVRGTVTTKGNADYTFTKTETGTNLGSLVPDETSLFVDTEATAKGFNPLVSVHVTPMEHLEIALQYQFSTTLEFEREYPPESDSDDSEAPVDVSQTFFPDEKSRADIPAMGSAGVSYRPMDALRVEASYTYYFNTAADWGNDANGEVVVDNLKDGWEAGLAVEYEIIPELVVSLGYLSTTNAATPEALSAMDWALNAQSVAGGLTWEFRDGLNATVGAVIVNYEGAKNAADEVMEFNQEAVGMALGLSARL